MKKELQCIIFRSSGKELDVLAYLLKIPKRLTSETDVNFRSKILKMLFGRNTKN